MEKMKKRVKNMSKEEKDKEEGMAMMEMLMRAANSQEKKWAEFPTFEKGDNPMDWLTEFWGVCIANKTSDDRRLQMLPVVLKGEAKRWYMRSRGQINKFGNLKKGTEGSFVKEFLEEFAGLK